MGSKTAQLGCCIAFFKNILNIINVLFLLLGIVVIITASILRWSSVLNKFTNIKGIDTLITLGSVNNISVAMLVLGGFIVLLSIFGLIGAQKQISFFLKVYLGLVIVIFLAMLISILVLIFTSSKIENEYKKSVNTTVYDINANFDADKCKIMKALSETFECCGSYLPTDFKNETVRAECCDAKFLQGKGCGPQVVENIKKNAINLLVIPSAIIMGIELFAIITTSCLVGRIGRRGN